LKDPSSFRDGVFFHNLARVAGKSDQIFMQILSLMYL